MISKKYVVELKSGHAVILVLKKFQRKKNAPIIWNTQTSSFHKDNTFEDIRRLHNFWENALD